MTRWLGRLRAALFVAGALLGFAAMAPDMHLLALTQPQLELIRGAQAQAGQQPGCPLQIMPKIVTAASYRLTSADRCDLVVLSNSGQITVQLPAPGLIFSPGWAASLLPINGGQITLTGLPDQAGVTHKVNLQTSLLLSAGSGVDLRILQDMNWWASARFSGSLPDAVAHNVLKVYPPRSDTLDGKTAWSMITPDQATVPGLSASTCSSGFNEAETYAALNGWSLEVYGSGEWTGEGSASVKARMVSTCVGDGFILQPIANRYVKLAVQLNCNGPANGGCLRTDSMMKGALLGPGLEVVSAPTTASSTDTCAVMLGPHTAIPNEGVIGIVDSVIDLGNIGTQPASGTARAALCINVAQGAIVSNPLMRVIEANPGGPLNTITANHAVQVFGASGVYSFAGNLVEIGHPHNANTDAIGIGETTSNQAFYNGNIWRIGYCDPNKAGTICVNTFGMNDDFTVGLMNGTAYQYMAYAHEGAANNSFNFVHATGATGASGLNPGFVDFSGTGAVAKWLNNFSANGKPFSLLGDDGEPLSGLAPTSVTSGTGASLGATSTMTKGSITVGTGNPTTASFAFAFTRDQPYRGCLASANVASANPLTLTTSNTTQVGWTAAAAMAAGTIVSYNCW